MILITTPVTVGINERLLSSKDSEFTFKTNNLKIQRSYRKETSTGEVRMNDTQTVIIEEIEQVTWFYESRSGRYILNIYIQNRPKIWILMENKQKAEELGKQLKAAIESSLKTSHA